MDTINQILTFIVASGVLPLVGWLVHQTHVVGECRRMLIRLQEMHDNPEEHKFGTEVTNRLLQEQHELLETMLSILAWQAEAVSGKPLPHDLKSKVIKHGK